MVDDAFEDAYLASLYDRINPWGPDDEFYLHLIASADRVLDVGCGTGRLLHRARDAGHGGRLVGIDPARGMLAQARRRDDVEWVAGRLHHGDVEADVETVIDGPFDLVMMTGHAFQTLAGDAEVRDLLAAVHHVLRPGGHFAFDTRNPLREPWTRWTADHVVEVEDEAGTRVAVWANVEEVDGEFVTFTQTFHSRSWVSPRTSRRTLRFLPAPTLDHLLEAAGFAIDERYGSWDRSLFTPSSPEIITVASRR